MTVAERYADRGLRLADASLVVLAEPRGTIEIATLDERHFRVERRSVGCEALARLAGLGSSVAHRVG
ncbi:MAG: hypothetical protein JO262_14040 [Solirubrobacterales bacterium]|nr:hypothetical protein [Solirubrobacterales bacterium]